MELGDLLKAICEAYLSGNAVLIEAEGETPFDKQQISFFPSGITSAKAIFPRTIAQEILQCNDLKTALELTSDPITIEEENALDELRNRLRPKLQEERDGKIREIHRRFKRGRGR